jgi:hypothetical protein
MPIKSFAHYSGRPIPCLLQDIPRTKGLTIPAHEAVKEVTPVDTNTNPMAATNPSSFGMPICGHAFAATFGGTETTSVVRDRQAVLKARKGLAMAYTWGPPAWSPPTS